MNKASNFIALVIFFSVFAELTSAQTSNSNNTFLKDILKKVKNITGNNDSLSSVDIVSGLKEALNVGTKKSVDKLSITDGFLKDAVVKILLPPEAQEIEKKLRMFGGGKLVDNAITSLNRAAEDASKKATPIFLSAIKKMNIHDALGILNGSDTSATFYLKKTTGAELIAAFKPIIDSSLIKVDATKYWKDIFTNYNKFFPNKVETDLGAYVTRKAMDGIFYYVAQEEKDIRKNPGNYASDILKRVFGKK